MSMKIKRLEIEGYKSLKHVVWEPGDLNVLIGPNGSGKSNLLRLLEMLSASARGELDKTIRNDGGFSEVCWDGRCDAIGIRLTLTPAGGGETAAQSEYLRYDLKLLRAGHSDFRIGFESLDRAYGINLQTITEMAPNQGDLKLLKRDNGHAIFYTPGTGAVAGEFLGSEVEERESGLGEAIEKYAPIAYQIKQTLRDWGVFHDFHTDKDAEIRKPSKTRNERQFSGNGQNLVNVLNTLCNEYPNFQSDLETAMRSAFGREFSRLEFPPSVEPYVEMKVRWKSLQRPTPAGELSDGTLRFLFLCSLLSNPNLPALVAIDEPETGLHPSMFPIIAELAVEASKHTQVVFTTHSPEFLNAFEEIPTVTVFNWKDGETQIRNVSGAALEHWLKEYKLGEAFSDGDLEAI